MKIKQISDYRKKVLNTNIKQKSTLHSLAKSEKGQDKTNIKLRKNIYMY